MALSFSGLQPVRFLDRECTPVKPDAELQLRLENIKTYNEEADEILASAFPNDREYVLNFLRNNMTKLEKEELCLYLLGGETGLRYTNTILTAEAAENAKARKQG